MDIMQGSRPLEVAGRPGRSRPLHTVVGASLVDAFLSQLERSSLLFVLDSLSEAAYLASNERRIVFWNAAAAALTGYSAAEMVGRTCSDDGLEHIGEDGCVLCAHGCPLVSATAKGEVEHRRAHLRHKDGHRQSVALTVCPLRNARGESIGSIQLFRPQPLILDSASAEKLAFIDPLVELPNRRHLELTLASRLSDLRRNGWPFGAIFLDVDSLKRVNDTHGHSGGDRLLRMVARSLAASLRASDVAGRWGGDEFLVVISNVDEVGLAAVARKLRVLVARTSGRDEAGTLSTTVSVGCTVGRPDDTIDSIVARADSSMYQAKRLGGDRVVLDGDPPAQRTLPPSLALLNSGGILRRLLRAFVERGRPDRPPRLVEPG